MKSSVAIIIAAVVVPWAKAAELEDIAFCGDCWCVPEEGESCPTDAIPQYEFPAQMHANLRNITLENPMELTCNPYQDADCDTQPPLEEVGVCVVEIVAPPNATQCPEEHTYRLKTMPSREDAERNLQIVTHEGPCGTCSSLQDLEVFMRLGDLSEIGSKCGFQALGGVEKGIACYKEYGFTEGCASIWVSNNLNTGANCTMCFNHVNSGNPDNLPAPGCELAECIQCDEDSSGPIFKKYAGRTRRNSGLLSKLVRPCNTVANLVHRDPCDSSPLTLPPTGAPTMAPTGSSGNRATIGWVAFGVLAFAL